MLEALQGHPRQFLQQVVKMGAGAASGIKAATAAASEEDIKKAFEGLSADDRAKIASALGAAGGIPNVCFVLGGPGAGKGTQSQNIIDNCAGWAHISAGDCLREERNNPDSKDGAMINEMIKEGKLVPAEVTVALLLKKMKSLDGKSKFLIDGFPRNFDNLKTWDEVIGSAAAIKAVFFFDTTEEIMEVRLIERGKTSGRADDNPESIKKRFKTYQDESFPVIQSFKEKGMVFQIDASPSAEEVWKVVAEKVKMIESPGFEKPGAS